MYYKVSVVNMVWQEYGIELDEGPNDTPEEALRLVLKGEGGMLDEIPDMLCAGLKGRAHDGDYEFPVEYYAYVTDGESGPDEEVLYDAEEDCNL